MNLIQGFAFEFSNINLSSSVKRGRVGEGSPVKIHLKSLSQHDQFEKLAVFFLDPYELCKMHS